MENKHYKKMIEYFQEVELNQDYNPYFCSVEDAISIVIVGTFCGFQNIKNIHRWASHERTAQMLKEVFGISYIPCYYHLTNILKMIEPTSLSDCFTRWVHSMLPNNENTKTVSIDGKTVRSTGNMECFDQPLHIVSAHIAEFGLTLGQEAVEGKTNEIPTAQVLIKHLKLDGCMVVADALNCQKQTAEAIREKNADYLLSVKDNQKTLKNDIKKMIQNPEIQSTLETVSRTEKRSDRTEKRTAFVLHDISWLKQKEDWKDLCFIGAIYSEFTTKKGTSSAWHYYISSKVLSPEELLQFARKEWSIESMHWLLDVHFNEDKCRVYDENLQISMNIIRKMVLNSMRTFKDKIGKRTSFPDIMMDCLVEPELILKIVDFEN